MKLFNVLCYSLTFRFIANTTVTCPSTKLRLSWTMRVFVKEDWKRLSDLSFFKSHRGPKNFVFARAHVLNSGPRAKSGTKCNHNWPARSYHLRIRAGPRFDTISFISTLISHVFVTSRFGCSRFCVQAKLTCFNLKG